MSCNLSLVSVLMESIGILCLHLVPRPMSLGHLQGNGGSAMFAAGGAETGLGWFCGCMATCFKMMIHFCCCSLKLFI